MPIEDSGGNYHRWAELLGEPMSFKEKGLFDSRIPELKESGHFGWPEGWTTRKTASTLAHTLETITDEGVLFVVAFSQIYDRDLSCEPTLPWNEEPSRSFIDITRADLFVCDNLDLVAGASIEEDQYLPVGIWPVDFSWALTSVLYEDKWFFSGSRAAYSVLKEAGLEVAEVPYTCYVCHGDV
jgi:hypothetical protein